MLWAHDRSCQNSLNIGATTYSIKKCGEDHFELATGRVNEDMVRGLEATEKRIIAVVREIIVMPPWEVEYATQWVFAP